MEKMNPRQITTKLLKTNDKEKSLKPTRGKMTYYVQQNKDKNDSRFHSGNNTKRQWSNIFKVLKKPVKLEIYMQKKYF